MNIGSGALNIDEQLYYIWTADKPSTFVNEPTIIYAQLLKCFYVCGNFKQTPLSMTEELIISIQSLIDLDPKEKDCIEQLFKEKSIKKGDFFLVDGQVCKQVGFIVKGLMRYYINHDGEDKTYAFADENNFVCNNESFIPQIPSTKIIQALEDCDLLQISYDDLQIFYNLSDKGNGLAGLSSNRFLYRHYKTLAHFTRIRLNIVTRNS